MRFNTDLHQISCLGWVILFDRDLWIMRLIASEDCSLTNQTEYAETVASVRGQFILENNIIEAQYIFCWHTNRCISWQDIDTILLRIRQFG